MSFLFSIIFPYLLFGHFIADFVFQSRKMAINKSSSIFWLSYHVIVYTIVLGFIVSPFFIWYYNADVFLQKLIIFMLVNGVLHWITDFFSSKLSSYFYEKSQKMFWTVVGFDQWIHNTCISLTFYYSFWW